MTKKLQKRFPLLLRIFSCLALLKGLFFESRLLKRQPPSFQTQIKPPRSLQGVLSYVRYFLPASFVIHRVSFNERLRTFRRSMPAQVEVLS